MSNTLYYIQGCPNCARFIESMKLVVHKLPKFQYCNVSKVHPYQRAHVRVVPTIVLATGKKLEGTAAFRWLNSFMDDDDIAIGGYEYETELPCTFFGDDGLCRPGKRTTMAPL